MSWLVDKTSDMLAKRTTRRGFLMRTAVAGTAVVVSPLEYILRPVTAYAAVCGCANSSCDCGSACCDGYTAFCCEVTGGHNVCPAGSFPGGWWRADGSIFCDGTRYIVDCNLSCDADWPSCRCAQGDCGRRRTACNWFRYGQCNEDIECYGPIACRMATCEPPYLLDLGCSDETFWDDSTANHSADCAAPEEEAGGGEKGGGEVGGGEKPKRVEAPGGDGETAEDRQAALEERARQRDAERAARQAQRDAERAERRAERDAERAAEDEA